MYAQARKYVMSSMSEAMAAIKKDLGEDAVILHKKRLSDTLSRNGGYFEVYATVDDFRKKRTPSRSNERVKQLEGELRAIKEAVSELVDLYKRKSDRSEEIYSDLEQKLVDMGIDESLLSTISGQFSHFSNDSSFEEGLERLVCESISKKKKTKQEQKIYIFLGPTGVGKTTTLAKISSAVKLDPSVSRDIVYICLDFYRLGASEQLKHYSKILECQTYLATNTEELMDAINKHPDAYIFIDTCGRSQLDEHGVNDTFRLLCNIGIRAYKYLVLSAVTKYEDMLEICDAYRKFDYDEVIFTKLDETTSIGNIFSLLYKTGMSMNYFTDGQDVPSDIKSVKSGSELARMMLKNVEAGEGK